MGMLSLPFLYCSRTARGTTSHSKDSIIITGRGCQSVVVQSAGIGNWRDTPELKYRNSIFIALSALSSISCVATGQKSLIKSGLPAVNFTSILFTLDYLI
jgi:hypothetical protein